MQSKMKNGVSRRRFLATSAAASAALCTPGLMRHAYAAGANKFTVWVWGGADRFDFRKEIFSRLYPEEYETYDINVQSLGAHGGEVYQSLRLALASGQKVPDVMQMNYTALPEFAEMGAMADISGLMSEYKDDMSEGAQGVGSYNGVFHAVPTELKAKIWYYDTEMFDKAGIDPRAVKTNEDYVNAGKAFREANPDSFFMNIGDTPIHYWYFMMLSHWPDLTVANRDGTFNLTSDPRFGEVLGYMKAWAESGIAMPIDDWSPDWQPSFANGKLGGALISSWFNAFLPKFAPERGGRWALAPWPEFNRAGSEAGGAAAGFIKGAENTEVAFNFFAKLHLATAGSVEDWKTRGITPVVKSSIPEIQEITANPTRPDGMSDEDWKVAPANFFGAGFMDPIFEAMEDFRAPNADPAMQAELDIMRRRTEAMLAGKTTIDEALEAMEKDMKRQIGNPYDV